MYGGSDDMGPNFEDSSNQITLSEVICELHKFDRAKSLYVAVCKKVRVCILQNVGEPKYILVVKDAKDGKKYCETAISTKIMPTFFHAKRAFTWVTFSSDISNENPVDSWSLRFPEDNAKDLSKFEKPFLEALYLASINDKKHNLNPEDKKYVDSAYHCEPMEVDDYSDSEKGDSDSTDYGDDDNALGNVTTVNRRYGQDQDVDSIAKKFNNLKVDNSLLSLSRLHERTFVVRGDNIGVYTNHDDKPKLSGVIIGIKDSDKNSFTPNRVMLHDRETGLVMSNPNDPGNLYKLDLERGIISDKWKVDENSVVKHFVPKSKYNQRTSEQEFLGVTPKSLVTIDPRLPGIKTVDTKSMKYTTNNKFSCLATTINGEVAVASDTGVVRLYDKTNIRAKTNLYGSGEPIIGLDTTEDGRYVLATCKTHLLIMDTLIPDTENSTGFRNRMGAKKPDPKRLQLRHEDAVRMDCKISFLPARFSSGDSSNCFIVTATGPYVIKWNLKRVNSNRLFDYTITKYKEDIVEDNFLYDSPKRIIVALPKSVELLKRQQLIVPKKVFH